MCYANAHALNLARRDAISGCAAEAALVLNDGTGVAVAAGVNGARLPSNPHRQRFQPADLGRAAERGWRVFLLGGRPGVAAGAAHRLAACIPGLVVAGTHHGYFDWAASDQIATRIKGRGPTWSWWRWATRAESPGSTGTSRRPARAWGSAWGRFSTFTAGVIPRAPRWTNKCGLEWTYRLARKPRRLWRRYVLGNRCFSPAVGRTWGDEAWWQLLEASHSVAPAGPGLAPCWMIARQ